MDKRILVWVLSLLITLPTLAWGASLRTDAPERYVVRRGDTLWGIAGRFLRDPWRWPYVWDANPAIENPHRIYPGDVIELVYVDGEPVLRLRRPDTVRLSPEVRREPLQEAIPTLPREAIRPFLADRGVTSEAALAAAPYVVAAADERIIAGAGNKVYVRGLAGSERGDTYRVVRLGQPLRDATAADVRQGTGAPSGPVLSHEEVVVATGHVERPGDPAIVRLTESSREVRIGDRLLPRGDAPFALDFLPRAPEQAVDGRVIGVLDGVSQVGQYQVVVLNRGAADGVEPGHVLVARRAGETVRDPLAGDPDATVTLPSEPAGLLMVFRTFDRVSYGVILRAIRPIHVLDAVGRPEPSDGSVLAQR